MRDNKKTKSTQFYSHCQRTGHTMDQCFKLIGYPDWFEGLKDPERAKKPAKMATNVQGYLRTLAPSETMTTRIRWIPI